MPFWRVPFGTSKFYVCNHFEMHCLSEKGWIANQPFAAQAPSPHATNESRNCNCRKFLRIPEGSKEQSRWKQTRWHTTKPLRVHLRGHPREHYYNTEKTNFCGHSRVHLREHLREHSWEPFRGSISGSYFAFASSVLHWWGELFPVTAFC